MITIKNLTKIYHPISPHPVKALDSINLKIPAHQIFGVIGKSGSGKSTLIRCINLLERPTTGEVILDKDEMIKLSSHQLRKKRRSIGMIFQHFNLLNSRTLYQNVALPLELIHQDKKKIKSRVNKLLDLVGLLKRANHYPDQLSGGEKQRVAIARALVTDPKWLLCDEPTSALDPESTISILNLLKRINQALKITTILITHEMGVIKKICDRVAILDHGQLVEEGGIIDIFTAPKSTITKQLTQHALHLELPNYLTNSLRPHYETGLSPVIQLAFIGSSTNEPIIANLLKKFQVTVSILQADLESIHNAAVGFLICKLMGKHEDIEQAIAYLKDLKLKVEVIGYV